MFIKRPNHRKFDYVPRFYDPLSDENAKRKKRLGFSRKGKLIRSKRGILRALVIVIFIIIFLMLLK